MLVRRFRSLPQPVAVVRSRSLGDPWAPLVWSVVDAVAAAGRGVAVGDARGADEFALCRALGVGAPVRFFSVGVPAAGGGSRFFGLGSSSSFRACSLALAVPVRGSAPFRAFWGAGGSPFSVPLSSRLRGRTRALVSFVASCPPPRLLVAFFLSPRSPGSLLACRLALRCGVPVVFFACGFSPALLPSWLSGRCSPALGDSDSVEVQQIPFERRPACQTA